VESSTARTLTHSEGSIQRVLSCCGPALFKAPQLAFGNGELRDAALEADLELWKHPHDGLVQTLESGEMNGDFSVEIALML